MFSKPLEELSCADIREFCLLQRKEGKHLDYKMDFPAAEKDALAKTVAAFANTQGGYLVCGVNDNRTDVPVPPYEGMHFREGLHNQVSQIVRDRVHPTPYLRVHVCKPENERTFVIIHVPQSTYAPHYLINHKSIYIRTGESSLPEDLIHPDTLPWLFDGRSKSVKLREQLIAGANNRFINSFPNEDRTVFSGGLIVPVYPYSELFPFHQTADVMRKIEGSERYSELKQRSIPGGMVFAERFEHLQSDISFAQLMNHGMFFLRRSVSQERAIESRHLVWDFCRLMFSARLLQQTLDIWAPIMIRFEVMNLQRKIIKALGGYMDAAELGIMDDLVDLTITLPGGLISENFPEVLMAGLRRLMWMLGKQHTLSEKLAGVLINDSVLPDDLRNEDFTGRLIKSLDKDLPLVEFEFSTKVPLILPEPGTDCP